MTCGAWVLVLGARGLGLKARVNNRTTGDNILVYESNFGDLSRLGSGSALLLKQYREGCLSLTGRVFRFHSFVLSLYAFYRPVSLFLSYDIMFDTLTWQMVWFIARQNFHA
jgi:hypothetical protein